MQDSGIAMSENQVKKSDLTYFPLTADRWHDFETLFGKRGACGGCWCMLWRLKRSEFESGKGDGNRNAMRAIVESGVVPGILAYVKDKPIAWCSVAPRENYPALERSRIMKKIDEIPVWSISCFFIDRGYRKQGVSTCMIQAAIDYVQRLGGNALEAYPVEPKKKHTPPAFAWTGLASAFKKAGFIECARRSETRPIMRYYIGDE
jgi:GNAT superfamily N-acetyltransferase